VLFCPAALPLSAQALSYVAGVIRRHRKKIGSAWRKLNPGRQALLVLAYMRQGDTFAELAAGFGIGTATAWRYVTETTALLAARAPKLRQALTGAKKAGDAYVVVDGTLIPIDRVAVLLRQAPAPRPELAGHRRADRAGRQGLPRRRRPGADPYRGRGKPASQKEANRAHARLRSPGERAIAQLKTWRILRKLRCCPWRAGQLARAIDVLQARESEG